MIRPLSAVEQQVIRLAIAMKQDRDRASQSAFEQAIAPVLTAQDCTGLTVKVIDHDTGLALEVSE
jgi:hypothetical protein